MWEEDARRPPAASMPPEMRAELSAKRALPATFFNGVPSIQLGIAGSSSVYHCVWKVTPLLEGTTRKNATTR